MGFDNSLTDFMTHALCAGDDEFILVDPSMSVNRKVTFPTGRSCSAMGES